MSSRWNMKPQPKYESAPSKIVAQASAPAQSGVADPNVQPYVPTMQLIVPQSTPQNACWNGSEVTVDFIIDRTLGKALNFTIQFDATVAGVTTADGCQIASSASLVNRIDWLVDGNSIETTYADMLFYENVVFKQDQELAQSASMLGVVVGPDSVTPANYANGSQTLYLPLTGAIPSMQPFLAGIKNELRLRLYLAPQVICRANSFVSDAAATFNLNKIGLWVEEGTTSPEAKNEYIQHHESNTVTYRSVCRGLWTRTEPSLTSGTQNTDILTGLVNDSAGLLVYFKNPSTDPGYFMSRYNLRDMQLLNGSGTTLTRVLPSALVEGQITPSTTPVGSSFVNSASFNTYIFPFSSSIERVRNSGKVLGGLKLTGNEQLVVTPSFTRSGGDATQANAVSFDYLRVDVTGGRMSWAKTATQ